MKITIALFLFWVTVAVSYGQSNSNTYINNLKSQNKVLYSGFKGDFSVSDDGSANYSIPILVTPGVGGMTPQLSISYNSRNSTSILGEGWSLNGLSLIGRAPNIAATDGYTKPVSFSASDKLQLDGQRLMLYNAHSDGKKYGDINTEYRTEHDTWKRITVKGMDESDEPVNGISYIVVESKDGLIYSYGEGYNSIRHHQGIVRTNTPGHTGIPYLWLLTEIKDRNGNWISFNYDIENNTYRPRSITYGKNGVSAEIGSVQFAYYNRNDDTNPWGWSVEKYTEGQKVIIDHPLQSVSSYYLPQNTANDQLQVRKYVIRYGYEKLSNKLEVEKIFQETNIAATHNSYITDSLNAIRFAWGRTKVTEKEFDRIITSRDTVVEEEDYKIAFADYNGDGFPDKLLYKNYGDKIVTRLALNDGKGNLLKPGKLQIIKDAFDKNAKPFVGDFNADGRNDLLFIYSDADSLSFRCYYSTVPTATQPDSFTGKYYKSLLKAPDAAKKAKYSIGDFNADGRSDVLLFFVDDSVRYRPLTFTPTGVQINKLLSADKGDIPDDSYIPYLTDLNGDGISDLLFTWTKSNGWFERSFVFKDSRDWGVSTASPYSDPGLSAVSVQRELHNYAIDTTGTQGTRIQSFSTQITAGDYSKLNYIILADINKDGTNDLIISNTNLKGWDLYCALGKGDGTFESPRKSTISTASFLYNHRANFGDFNGDGNLDVILQKTDQDGWHKLVAYGDGRGAFRILNGDGRFEKIFTNNFSYSQNYLTTNVLPTIFTPVYVQMFSGDHKVLDQVVACGFGHECLMKNIRMIYQVETGFYPGDVNRPYDNPFGDPLKDIVPPSLNYDRNVKRIINAYYTRDSTINGLGLSWSWHSAITYGDYWQPYVLDMNGDGISDLVLTYTKQIPSDTALHQGHNPLEDSTYTFIALNKFYKPGMVKTIYHSDKSIIGIRYGSVLKNQAKDLPPLPYPFLPSNAAIFAVTRVASSNGLKAYTLNPSDLDTFNPFNNQAGFGLTSYVYTGGVIALNGRGFLGFVKSSVTNETNGNQTVKDFYQTPAWMVMGILPARKTSTFIAGRLIAEENKDYQLIRQPGEDHIAFFTTTLNTQTFDPAGQLTSLVNSSFQYDNFGNLTNSLKTRGSAPNVIKQTVQNTYYETIGENDNFWQQNWLIGRLKTSAIVTERDGEKEEKQSEFYYDDQQGDRSTGQLIKEITNKQDPSLSITKEYQLNELGNIKTSIVYPTATGNGPFAKIVKTEYTADGRFVQLATDAEGYQTTKVIDPIQGLVQLKIDGNRENVVKTKPDPLGRTQYVESPDGRKAYLERRLCANCELADKAAYFSIDTNNVSLPTVSYYDCSDRLIRTVSFDFKNQKIFTDNEFDEYGNIKREGIPYFAGEVGLAAEYQYDKLNRQESITYPNHTTIRHVYQGLAEIIINSKNQKNITVKNILGELERAIDAKGNAVTYTADMQSRILTIKDATGAIYESRYDVFGNRVSYQTPNFKKPETVKYNAFNEKVYFKDPIGNEKYYTYDKIGRLIRMEARTADHNEVDSLVYHYFPASINGFGQGKLKEIITYSDDHPMNERFSYNAAGQLAGRTFEYRQHPFVGIDGYDQKTFTYSYKNGLLMSIAYPFDPANRRDKKPVVNYTYKYGTLTHASLTVQLRGGNGTMAPKTFNVWNLSANNAQGMTESYQLGDGINATRKYDDKTYAVKEIRYSAAQLLCGVKYDYDMLGNMIYREDLKNNQLWDQITYDELNRITTVNSNGYVDSLWYKANGDLLTKKFGNEKQLDLEYNVAGNQIKSFKFIDLTHPLNIRQRQLHYDNYGNQTVTTAIVQNHQEDIIYNQFNLPARIDDMHFYYAADNSKVGMAITESGTVWKNVAYLAGLSEFTYSRDGGITTAFQKVNILVNGVAVAYYQTNEENKIKFLLKDAHNTVIGVATNTGVLNTYAYDVWGLARNAAWRYDWVALARQVNDPSAKGYLNNIALEGINLVDMGARLYDPVMGRFISPDPVTSNQQSPSQFFAGYSYCNNNPAVFQDANGKFFWVVIAAAAFIGASAAGGSLLPWEWNDNWWKGALVGAASALGGFAVGPAIYTGGGLLGASISGAVGGFAGGFTATLVNGGSFGQALESGFKNGIIGGVAGGATFQIGSAFINPEFGSGAYFEKAALHGLNQGLVSEALGGSFEHGFLAGSFTSLAQPGIQIGGTSETRIMLASLVGGTASALGGGKFANGALSGTMVQYLNEESHSILQRTANRARFAAEAVYKYGLRHLGIATTIDYDAADVDMCDIKLSDFKNVKYNPDGYAIDLFKVNKANVDAWYFGGLKIDFVTPAPNMVLIRPDEFNFEYRNRSFLGNAVTIAGGAALSYITNTFYNPFNDHGPVTYFQGMSRIDCR